MSNIMWQIEMKKGTSELKDIVIADVENDNYPLFSELLSSNNVKQIRVETERGKYLVMYDGNFVGTHTSVIVWKYENSGDAMNIKDLQTEEDSWIIEPIWRYWLMAEKTSLGLVKTYGFRRVELTRKGYLKKEENQSDLEEIKHLGSMKPSPYETAIYSRSHSKKDLPKNRKRSAGTGY